VLWKLPPSVHRAHGLSCYSLDPDANDPLRSSWTEVWWIGEKPGQKNEHNEQDSHYGNPPPKRLLVFVLVERPVTHVYFALFDGYKQLPGKIADPQIQK
jgi:hypothetical protein